MAKNGGMYGEVLWAYNHEHLDMEQHVAAKLRERNGFKYRIKVLAPDCHAG
ncbi:MAG: hypothetical protein R2778_01350 [Saprospiraceae bacterium]